MSKRIYVLVWTDENGNARIDGYWNRPLTEEEQHGYFKKQHPRSYEPCHNTRRDITWELKELKGAGKPVPLPNHQWAGFKPEW